MADTGRESMTDKAKAAAMPESQKSYAQQAVDTVKGTMDSAASTLQPESMKSYTQQAGDTVSGNQNQNASGLMGEAQNTAGSAVNTAQGVAQGAMDAGKDMMGMKK